MCTLPLFFVHVPGLPLAMKLLFVVQYVYKQHSDLSYTGDKRFITDKIFELTQHSIENKHSSIL